MMHDFCFLIFSKHDAWFERKDYFLFILKNIEKIFFFFLILESIEKIMKEKILRKLRDFSLIYYSVVGSFKPFLKMKTRGKCKE